MQRTAGKTKERYRTNRGLKRLYFERKYPQRDKRRQKVYAENPTMHISVLVSRLSQLEAKVAKLERGNGRLLAELSLINAEASKTRQANTDHLHESSLSMLCELLNIQTFPEDPAEALRGLLAEFNIKESPTDIIRDVRENR